MLQGVDPSDPRLKRVPAHYHTLMPLDADEAAAMAGGSMGYVTTLYKVRCMQQGCYFRKQVEGLGRRLPLDRGILARR